LSSANKATKAAPGGTLDYLTQKGFTIYVPDLIGFGETGPGDLKGDAYDFKIGRGAFNIWFAAMQTANSLVGIRCQDINRMINVVKQQEPNFQTLHAIAVDNCCPVLMHSAVFESEFTDLVFINPLTSYQSIVLHQYYQPEMIHSTVAGALTQYDLPDLLAARAPNKALLIDPVNYLGKKSREQEWSEELSVVFRTYRDVNSIDKIKLYETKPQDQLNDILYNWLK
jgi:hypothetical protein